jgi:diguanylate cyclase (GGDEF)-like protein/PAS domain S-box-containing protein
MHREVPTAIQTSGAGAPLTWEHLLRLLDFTADWVWEQDSEHRFTRVVSASDRRASADCPPSFKGKTIWEVDFDVVDSDWARHRARLDARESFRDLLLTREDSDGTRHWLRVSGEPRYDAQGLWCGYHGVANDATSAQQQRTDLRQLHASLDASLDCIMVSDVADMRYIYVNETSCQMTGYTREEVMRARPYEVAQVTRQELASVYAKTIAAGPAGRTYPPRLIANKDGTRRGWWEVHQRAATIDGRHVIVTSSREVTHRVLAKRAAERARRLYATLSETNEAIIRAHSASELFERVCTAAVHAGGFPSASILLVGGDATSIEVAHTAGVGKQQVRKVRMSVDESVAEGNGLVGIAYRTRLPCVSADYLADPRTVPWHHLAARIQLKSAAALPIVKEDRTVGVLHLSATERNAFDDETVELLTRMTDNIGFALLHLEHEAERERTEERIRYLATHDGLTGLPNRVLFSELLNVAIRTAQRHRQALAVMFIDLDRFKVINDSLGHEAGDALLKEMSLRLCAVLRASDIVGRLGGDVFVVLLPYIHTCHDAGAVARKLLGAAMEPLNIREHDCRVTASIGISLYPDHGDDEQTLMKNADTAMYLAKEQGKNTFEFYSHGAKTQSIERLALEAALRTALARNEFVLQYQAKLDLQTNRISGVEALLRWHHPEMGTVAPNQFIPLCEETGAIVPIGRWVLRTACAQNVEWQRQGLPPVSMAVNISARQFADPDLLNDIAAALRETGMAPELLELELTETMVMHDPARTVEILKQLKAMGIRIALDDFGVGYSSLAQIKGFPIDILKVDRSFIRNLPESTQDRAITEAIINMAKSLSLLVVAEGVETADQEVFLRGIACDASQGFYFSKPCAPEDFAALLSRQRATSD